MGTGRSCMVSFTMMIQVETKGESKLLPHPHVSGTVANVRHNQEWAGDWLGCGLCLGVPPVLTPVSLPESTVFYTVFRCSRSGGDANELRLK